MKAHTPGPWYYSKNEDCIIRVCRKWDDAVKPGESATFGSFMGAHIADVQYNSGVPTKEQAEANARLIAAAPELLEALEDLVAYCSKEYPVSELDEARDLIEKVKGE